MLLIIALSKIWVFSLVYHPRTEDVKGEQQQQQ